VILSGFGRVEVKKPKAHDRGEISALPNLSSAVISRLKGE
jgi:hypothetical protein